VRLYRAQEVKRQGVRDERLWARTWQGWGGRRAREKVKGGLRVAVRLRAWGLGNQASPGMRGAGATCPSAVAWAARMRGPCGWRVRTEHRGHAESSGEARGEAEVGQQRRANEDVVELGVAEVAQHNQHLD